MGCSNIGFLRRNFRLPSLLVQACCMFFRNFTGKEEVWLHALKLALEDELAMELGDRTIDADTLGRELRIKNGDKVHKDTFDFVFQDGIRQSFTDFSLTAGPTGRKGRRSNEAEPKRNRVADASIVGGKGSWGGGSDAIP